MPLQQVWSKNFELSISISKWFYQIVLHMESLFFILDSWFYAHWMSDCTPSPTFFSQSKSSIFIWTLDRILQVHMQPIQLWCKSDLSHLKTSWIECGMASPTKNSVYAVHDWWITGSCSCLLVWVLDHAIKAGSGGCSFWVGRADNDDSGRLFSWVMVASR